MEQVRIQVPRDDRYRSSLALGPAACLRLYVQGKLDGRRWFARITGEDRNTTPFVRRELDRCRRFNATQWLLCEHATAAGHVEIARMDGEVARLEALSRQACEQELQHRAAYQEKDLSLRKAGEQTLSDNLIRSRRTSEMHRSLRAITAVADEAQRQIRTLLVERARLVATIAEVEHVCALRCSRYERRVEQRLAAYRQAACNACGPRESIWPIAVYPQNSSEDEYRARHYPTRKGELQP
ncbi:MAG: hypothetical protein LBU48_04360 [Coriobacteriales bacterium]|jgi:hypothetical protein|nr:hypothetical protein [Coriobacteriales bacterium]